ncbi:MAG: FTR1 family protein [Actinomycetota bacterium]|nr:FTR1 family protein [Actinomycetota bacterium]
MVPALLIMIREGFEAALIVAIVFAYLRRIGRLDLGRSAWAGVAGAVGLSILIGVVVHLTLGNLVGAARLRSFAAVSLAAAGILTWMIFWMRRQARAIKNELEHKVDGALLAGNPRRAVVAVTFLAVIREGIEAALFLLAVGTSSGGGQVVLGAVVGLSIAVGLGLAVYAGGRRLPIRTFFQVTGMVIVVFAAGLLARSVLFLQASGDLGTLADNVYDVTGVTWLTQQSEVGKILAALFGWDPRPSIEQVVAWLGYFVPVTYLFLRRPGPTRPPSPAGPPSQPGDATRPAASPEPATIPTSG